MSGLGKALSNRGAAVGLGKHLNPWVFVVLWQSVAVISCSRDPWSPSGTFRKWSSGDE